MSDEQHLVRDPRAQPEEVVGSWSDITERKKAEEAVAAARERVEHLLASSPAVIYSFKATRRLRTPFISQNVKDLLGYDREEYLDSPDFWLARVHPETAADPRATMALCSKRSAHCEYRFRKKDGSYCWVSDELRLISDRGGEPVEVVGSWSDITARKQLGEAAGRRAEPSRASFSSRTGGDLQL